MAARNAKTQKMKTKGLKGERENERDETKRKYETRREIGK